MSFSHVWLFDGAEGGMWAKDIENDASSVASSSRDGSAMSDVAERYTKKGRVE
jgi:hypothetical protein